MPKDVDTEIPGPPDATERTPVFLTVDVPDDVDTEIPEPLFIERTPVFDIIFSPSTKETLIPSPAVTTLIISVFPTIVFSGNIIDSVPSAFITVLIT